MIESFAQGIKRWNNMLNQCCFTAVVLTPKPRKGETLSFTFTESYTRVNIDDYLKTHKNCQITAGGVIFGEAIETDNSNPS